MVYVQTYLFLELLVDSIQGVFDCYALQIPRCNFESQWKVQVNFFDWWCGEELFQNLFLVKRCRRCVELPGQRLSQVMRMLKQTSRSQKRPADASTRPHAEMETECGHYQLSFCVSFAICSSFPSFSSLPVSLLF